MDGHDQQLGLNMRSYTYLMSSTGSTDHHYVELLESKLRELLRNVLSKVPVDEPWYLTTYPDVAEAVKNGHIKSAREHYIVAGFYEDRQPRQIIVDEAWYLKEYPDVAEAIKSGAFNGAAEHFDRDGYKEGRLAAPGWSLLNP